jgi:small-conductance mechanosensitive channel
MIENSDFWDGKASAFVDAAITYDSDLDKAQEIMYNAVVNHPDFLDTRTEEEVMAGLPMARVYLRDLSIYGVQLRISMWTKSIGLNFDACADARETIKKDFDAAGIKFSHVTSMFPQ